MKSNTLTNIASYAILIAITGLLFPLQKTIITSILIGAYSLLVINSAISKQSVASYFIIFMFVPIAAFLLPSPIPSSLSPLLQLAIAVAFWGSVLSLVTSLTIHFSNRNQRHSNPPSTSPQDHAPK